MPSADPSPRPDQPAFVEIVTNGHIASGRCEEVNARMRLIDVLLSPDDTIALHDATVQSIRPGLPTTAEIDVLLIRRQHVLAASVIESANVLQLRREFHRTELLEKAPHEITMFAPPFWIEGLIHIAPNASVTATLPKLLQGFFPVTAATIRHELGAMTWKRDIVVVNGPSVHLVCPLEAVHNDRAGLTAARMPAPPRFFEPDDAA